MYATNKTQMWTAPVCFGSVSTVSYHTNRTGRQRPIALPTIILSLSYIPTSRVPPALEIKLRKVVEIHLLWPADLLFA